MNPLTRRAFLQRVGVTALGAMATRTWSAPADRRPNIVFLLTDDQTDFTLGCYGNDQVVTPNIDRLAAEGVMFRRYYNTTSFCMASRCNVMTGMYEYKTGCNFNHGPLHSGAWARSYPVLLRKAGYFTGLAGKTGFDVKKILPDDNNYKPYKTLLDRSVPWDKKPPLLGRPRKASSGGKKRKK